MNPDILRVYAVTPPLDDWQKILKQCEEIVKSGVKIIQLRGKDTPDKELIERARELHELLQKHGARLIINDRVPVAQAVGAAGVHLGQTDLPVAEARKLLGPEAIIGVSARTPEEARQAEAAGANYIGTNGVFRSRTKTDLPDTPLGLEGVRRLRESTTLPLVAIGGITPENAQEVIKAGADGVAVISALFAAEKIREAAERLEQAVREGLRERRDQEAMQEGIRSKK